MSFDSSKVRIDPCGLPDPTAPPKLWHWKDQYYLDAADQGRAQPGTWIWVGSGVTPKAADDQFVREITRGDREILGGRTEQWNACAVPMVQRGDHWVTVQQAGGLIDGDHVVVHRFIAYLGPRTV